MRRLWLVLLMPVYVKISIEGRRSGISAEPWRCPLSVSEHDYRIRPMESIFENIFLAEHSYTHEDYIKPHICTIAQNRR
uniref:Putative secreted protein n=1 Tax=Anopheles darlingi TaxID=43151 RepID=A0A2M4DL66_ANODA